MIVVAEHRGTVVGWNDEVTKLELEGADLVVHFPKDVLDGFELGQRVFYQILEDPDGTRSQQFVAAPDLELDAKAQAEVDELNNRLDNLLFRTAAWK